MKYPYKILLIIINFLFLSLINAQDFQKVDSLELSLRFAEDPKNKVDILLNLSSEFKNNDPDKALEYAKKANNLAEEIDYDKGILNSMIIMARTYFRITDYKMAMEFAVKAKELAEELSMIKELAQSLYRIGMIYFKLDDYNKSGEYFYEGLRLTEQIDNKEERGLFFNGIGSINFQQKNFDKALEYYFKSLNIAKENNDRNSIARYFNNISVVYGAMEEYIKACQYTEKALDINIELKNRKSEAINYINLGLINLRMKNYTSAFEYLQQALLRSKNLNHALFIAKSEVALGDYFLKINDIERSLEYTTKAMEKGINNGFKTIVLISSELLSKIYLTKYDTLNSYKYDIIKYRMMDSLNIEKSSIELTKLDLQYKFNIIEQEKRTQQQRKDFIVIIIIICLIFGIIMLFARQKIKTKHALHDKQQLKKEIEYKNKELAINVMSLIKKNEMLSGISDKLIKVRGEAIKEETKEALEKIALKLKKSTESEIWEEFELRFKQVHVEFYSKLLEKFPDLSPGEQRLCAFLRLNMSTKEISELTGQRTNTIEMSRYRIRKKFGISNSEINLITFLSHI